MKSRFLVSLLSMTVACSVIAAGDFEDIPYFPEGATTARFYSDGKLIRTPYSSFVQGVLDELYRGRSRDIFDLWGPGRSIGWDEAPPPGNELVVSRINCPAGLECVIMNTQAATFLITFEKNYQRIIDHSIISAFESVRDEELGYNYSGLRIGTLPFNVQKTDYFCSQVSGRDISGYIVYKRQITSEGKIENKQVDSWDDCKAS